MQSPPYTYGDDCERVEVFQNLYRKIKISRENVYHTLCELTWNSLSGAKRPDAGPLPAGAGLQPGEGKRDAVPVPGLAQEVPGGPHPQHLRPAPGREGVLSGGLAPPRQRRVPLNNTFSSSHLLSLLPTPSALPHLASLLPAPAPRLACCPSDCSLLLIPLVISVIGPSSCSSSLLRAPCRIPHPACCPSYRPWSSSHFLSLLLSRSSCPTCHPSYRPLLLLLVPITGPLSGSLSHLSVLPAPAPRPTCCPCYQSPLLFLLLLVPFIVPLASLCCYSSHLSSLIYATSSNRSVARFIRFFKINVVPSFELLHLY